MGLKIEDYALIGDRSHRSLGRQGRIIDCSACRASTRAPASPRFSATRRRGWLLAPKAGPKVSAAEPGTLVLAPIRDRRRTVEVVDCMPLRPQPISSASSAGSAGVSERVRRHVASCISIRYRTHRAQDHLLTLRIRARRCSLEQGITEALSQDQAAEPEVMYPHVGQVLLWLARTQEVETVRLVRLQACSATPRAGFQPRVRRDLRCPCEARGYQPSNPSRMLNPKAQAGHNIPGGLMLRHRTRAAPPHPSSSSWPT